MLKKLAIFIPTLFFIYLISVNWQIFTILQTLSDVTVENINIGEKSYALRQGKIYIDGRELFWFAPQQREKVTKILRTAGFYMWAKEDPLFTSPDFNGEEFEKSVKLMEQAGNQFQKDLNLKYDLFPIKFLKSVSQVKRATDIFLQEPSLDNAQKLINYQYETLNYYREDIQQRLRLMNDEINDKNRNVNIMFLAVATTPQIILNDYKILLDNAKELEDEISKREQCLEGKGQCVRPFRKFPNLKVHKTPPANKPHILSDDILFPNKEQVNFKRTGPFSVLTSCLGLNEKLGEQKQIYYLLEQQGSNYPTAKDLKLLTARVATEMYFRKATEVITKDRILRNLGLFWSTLTATATYNCPDSMYLAKLSTINNFMGKLKNQQLFNKTDKIIVHGKLLENKLISADIKDFDNFEELGNLYLQFYYEVYSDTKLASLQKKADTFLATGLSMQRLLSDIHLVLDRATNEFILLSMHGVLDNIETGNLYLYGIRNIPSLTYFTFSKSFFRLNNQPQYYQHKLVDNIGFDKHYLTYSLALTQHTKEEILSWVHNRNSVMTEVYNRYIKFKEDVIK